ncbi:MAG TPA: hypothetical protein VH165_30725 [Kofleriaceae bacterium]|jgi:hypothetical protein|nr:hypothetical protein [Kofleriaceae bacterium]
MTALRYTCLVLCLCAAACGADTAGCATPSELAGPAPAHATTADVQAILAQDCALGGCHLRAPGAGGLVLDVTSTAWLAATVGVPAVQNPTMDLVTPGDPDRSWLALKISGELCGASCDPALGCGAQMPFGEPLRDADRAIIVAWIAAGAR